MTAGDHLSQQFIPRSGKGNVDLPVSEYKKHYGRGWTSSAKWSGSFPTPLERADDRGEHPAWYDGFSDHAVGRPKHTYLEARRRGVDVDSIDY